MKNEPASCKNCKTNPCLNGKPVTFKNFVDKATVKGDCWHEDGTLRHRTNGLYYHLKGMKNANPFDEDEVYFKC